MGAQRLPDRPQGGAPAPRRGRRAVGYGSSHLSGSVKVALFVSVIAAAAAVATAGSAAVRPQSQTGATTGGHATELALAPRATPAIKATLAWSNLGLPDATAPVALSSPIPADLDGTMSVMFGDRAGNLFAFHLSDGTIPAGWSDVTTGHPVDSTPSVAPGSGRTSDIYVGSGNDAENEYGGYNAFGPSGNHLWTTTVANPPTNPPLPVGVEAGITVGYAGNRPEVVAGTLGQAQDALDPSSGAPLSGWPFFTSDSVHSTAALADLYGTGQNEIVDGGDQTAGLAYGQRYFSGGHIRVLNGQGGLICHGDTDQVVDSSPAVGGFLAWGLTGIVTGTGTFFPDVADSDRVIAFNTNCQRVWSTRLDGGTISSPALADVLGNGSLDVVEGTDQGTNRSGSVYALNGVTGSVIWRAADIGRIIGSVVTADLTGQGYQDVLVPTINGLFILDGRTGQQVAEIGQGVGLQNAPLVTEDPGGGIGITLAGYSGACGCQGGIGVVEHYTIAGSGAEAVGSGSWPMFHHDPQLTGNAGGTTPAGSVAACSVPSGALPGYYLAAADGGVFAFGSRPFCGSMGGRRLSAPIVGMATDPDTGGYWLVGADGGVFAFGGARYYGSMGGVHLAAPVVGMAATSDGRGYWLVGSDGGVFAFGDAQYFGSLAGTGTTGVVSISPAVDDGGYRLTTAAGVVSSFGVLPNFGPVIPSGTAGRVVAVANDPANGGYWLGAENGGTFTFGPAPFAGSAFGFRLLAPIVDMASTLDGYGYWLVGADGGVFTFGDASYWGSLGGLRLNAPIVAISGS